MRSKQHFVCNTRVFSIGLISALVLFLRQFARSPSKLIYSIISRFLDFWVKIDNVLYICLLKEELYDRRNKNRREETKKMKKRKTISLHGPSAQLNVYNLRTNTSSVTFDLQRIKDKD